MRGFRWVYVVFQLVYESDEVKIFKCDKHQLVWDENRADEGVPQGLLIGSTHLTAVSLRLDLSHCLRLSKSF